MNNITLTLGLKIQTPWPLEQEETFNDCYLESII